jgi:hypothetical protein
MGAEWFSAKQEQGSRAMPLNGEQVWWASAWTGGGPYTATWTVDFPPNAVFAKVWPAFYMEYHDDRVGMVHTFISRFRRRLTSGADQTVNAGNVPAVFDNNMTSVTYGLYIYNCQAQIVLDLGFWS